jgi:hypothetical protein
MWVFKRAFHPTGCGLWKSPQKILDGLYVQRVYRGATQKELKSSSAQTFWVGSHGQRPVLQRSLNFNDFSAFHHHEWDSKIYPKIIEDPRLVAWDWNTGTQLDELNTVQNRRVTRVSPKIRGGLGTSAPFWNAALDGIQIWIGSPLKNHSLPRSPFADKNADLQNYQNSSDTRFLWNFYEFYSSNPPKNFLEFSQPSDCRPLKPTAW